jgi:hypothetical protein
MGKFCTRQHLLELKSYNFVERQCLDARCLFERTKHDFGYDGDITTIRPKGEVENGEIKVQVKASSKVKYSEKHKGYVFDFSKRDLELWLGSNDLVILILYDGQNDRGYYIPLEDYFKRNRLSLRKVRKFIRVYFPPANLFDTTNIQSLRKLKNEIYYGNSRYK